MKLSHLIVLLLASFAHSAPAPRAKEAPKPTVSDRLKSGRYDLHWGKETFDTTLGEVSAYRAVGGLFGLTWEGTWAVDKDVLRIDEAVREYAQDAAAWQTYEIVLDPETLSGKVKGGHRDGLEVSLRPKPD